MNGEYAGFFDIGMVQRNEANAIIVHGTMCLIRRAAMEAAGGWSSDTICEDTDLGLTLLEAGWHAHYTNRRYGHGLLPDSFEAYKKQRDRWAYGGFQILKKHWRRFLPGASRLTREQKREFASAGSTGWAPRRSAWWSPCSTSSGCRWLPSSTSRCPTAFSRCRSSPASSVTVAHFLTLYRLRLRADSGQLLGSVVAAMSVQWTVARAVGFGLIKDHLPFVRTAKGGAQRSADFPAFWEAVLATLLILGAVVLVETNIKQVREIYIFAAVLAIQSLPFIAAVGLALIERTRLNDFATWRSIDLRLLPRLAKRAPALVKAAAPERELVK